jgi:hypothetical protein
MKRTPGSIAAAAVLAAVLAVAACGKATSPSPVSPSSTTSSSESSGTSSGRVQISGKIASINASARSIQLETTVVLVPVSATLASSAGQVEFKDLQVEMEIQVEGTMQGNILTAEHVQVDDHGNDGNAGPGSGTGQHEVEFTGSIASVAGACPDLTLSVAGHSAKTNNSTAFLKAPCTVLHAGATVEVSGMTQTDGSVMATRVQVDDDGAGQAEPEPGDQQETEFRGSVSSVSGGCPSLSLLVAGRAVTSGPATEFQGGACGDITKGVTLEVKGMGAKDGSVAASRLKIDR